jgi:hypothetical protein
LDRLGIAVLRGQEGALCAPFLGGEEKRCAWPGLLALDLGDTAGSFRQEWTLETPGFVPLPGEARRWPLDLQLDGRLAAAVERQGVPGLWLPAGTHTVTGEFRWDVLPESLAVSPEVGLVVLTVRGTPVLRPERDDSGRVFLRGGRMMQTEEDRLDIRVERKVVDSVPLVLVTRIELAVAGKAREVLLGRALPDGFLPLSLSGPLPARLEPPEPAAPTMAFDRSRLRVQVRPGSWVIELAARHAGPATAITAPVPGGPWGSEEVWVFEAQPRLRLAEVEGVPAVDPQQTTLPEEWKSLPAYRLQPGQTFRLTVRRRGAADPPADRLTLHRKLWLDFDGGGFTWQDSLQGDLSRSWRLEMAPPARLERVSIAGREPREQGITRRPGSPLAGVEVREGKIELTAEGRLPGRSSLPAVGWNHDFQEVRGTLAIPPGWRILGATGVDRVPGTWIDRWTLLDFFLVLLIALAVRHLWGNRWALLALATLVLTWHEPGAPHWIWVLVLGTEALRRVVREDRAGRLVRVLSGLSLAVLTLIAVAFLARQVRQAIYPALERSATGEGLLQNWAVYGAQKRAIEETAATTPMLMVTPEATPPARSDSQASLPLAAEQPELQETDPRAVVSTGPGLPDWQWSSVELQWSSPVDKEQRMHLFLVPPAGNFVLTLIRAALLLLLVLRALVAAGLRIDRRFLPGPPENTAAAAVLFLTLLSLATAGPAAATEAPPVQPPAPEKPAAPAPRNRPPQRAQDGAPGAPRLPSRVRGEPAALPRRVPGSLASPVRGRRRGRDRRPHSGRRAVAAVRGADRRPAGDHRAHLRRPLMDPRRAGPARDPPRRPAAGARDRADPASPAPPPGRGDRGGLDGGRRP